MGTDGLIKRVLANSGRVYNLGGYTIKNECGHRSIEGQSKSII